MSRATVVDAGGSRIGTRAPAKRLGVSWPALVPAAAVPVLFLHLRYQPKAGIGLRSTTIGIELSDVAVLAIVLTAAVAGSRNGWGPLRATRRLWLAAAVFLGVVLAATVYPLLRYEQYPFLAHAVTAAKFCEYALLAPAIDARKSGCPETARTRTGNATVRVPPGPTTRASRTALDPRRVGDHA